MHEILPHLPAGSYVLDLGSRSGSFDRERHPFVTVRVDIERMEGAQNGNLVQADAASLPFHSESFDAVISNHSLEHFDKLDEALRELGRIAKKSAALYAAVPDAGSVTDRLYRWLGRGGGHVNAFTSPDRLIQKIEAHTGLPHAGTRVLYTSLSFLNAKNRVAPAPRKMILLGGGREGFLVFLNHVFRLLDRWAGTRAAVYGWALYFGSIPVPVEVQPWSNVCARCGSGHRAASLLAGQRVVRRYKIFRLYKCPDCGAANLFHPDAHIPADVS